MKNFVKPTSVSLHACRVILSSPEYNYKEIHTGMSFYNYHILNHLINGSNVFNIIKSSNCMILYIWINGVQ